MRVELNEDECAHLSLVVALYISLVVYTDIFERACRPADCSAMDVLVSSPLHAVADDGDCVRPLARVFSEYSGIERTVCWVVAGEPARARVSEGGGTLGETRRTP